MKNNQFTTAKPNRIFSLLTCLFSLAIILAGCEYDIGTMDSGSEMALLMNEEDMTLQKKQPVSLPLSVQQLTTGLQGASGSTIGPGGALYVAEFAFGRISRIDPETGEVTTFASGLPTPVFDIGGVWDVVFQGGTAYALVTLVGPEIGGNPDDVVGIYRIDGPTSYTVIANIGAFSLANPPSTGFFVPTGVQYSIHNYRGGFLVADGHHNRVLHVTTDGEISEFKTFGNIVPTGLEVSGNTVYMAQAGPTPHAPEDGKVVSFGPNSSAVTLVASGAPLLVDVEINRGGALYGLAQGQWDGVMEGSPAIPDDGSLVKVNQDGTFTVIAEGLDRPTSIEFIKNTAYILTLTGEVMTVEQADSPPFGI